MVNTFLHVGAHRCATTTFQKFLGQNRLLLDDQSIAVWTPEQSRKGIFSGMIRKPGDTQSPAATRGQRGIELVQLETKRLALAEYQALIVTEENMIGTARNNLRTGRLYPQLGARLRNFADAFQGNVRRVCLTIRSYDDYWASAIAFAVARGHAVPNAEKLNQLVSQGRRWVDVACEIGNVFPTAEVVVVPFDGVAGHPDALLSTMHRGIDTQSLTKVDPIHAFNRSPGGDQLRKILRARGIAPDVLPAGDARWMPFDAGQQQTLRHQYKQDMIWLHSDANTAVRLVEKPVAQQTETIKIRRRAMEVMGGLRRDLIAPLPDIGGHYGTQRRLV